MDGVQTRWLRPAEAVVVTVAVLLAAFSGIAAAQSQVGSPLGTSGLISLDVVEADLAQVVRILTLESRQNIVVGDPDMKQKKVTATLHEVPLETALKHIVESVGCTWHREPDGVYIIGSKSLAQPASPAPTSTALEPSVPLVEGGFTAQSRAAVSGRYEPRRETRVETMKLYNTGPVDMMWLLGVYEFRDAPKIEAAPFKPGVYLQKPDGSLDALVVPSEPTPPLTEALKANPAYAQRALGPAEEAAQYPPSPPSYPGQRPTQYPGRPGQVTPTGAPVGPPGTAPGQQGAGLLPEGIDFIMPYELDNSLIVRGDEEGIEELKTIIGKLDIAPKQIMIKAEFVQITTSEAAALGINWTLERMSSTLKTEFNPPGNVAIGYANGNIMAALRTQLSQQKAKLINAPIISTLNNVPATINIGTVEPYLTSQTIFSSQGVPNTTTVVQFMPIQTSLFVLPRVNNADNSITVNIMPQISNKTGTVDTPNGKVPIQTFQSLQTNRRVQNGETIVIGGIIHKSDDMNIQKIPLLGDLPIIGPLFRSTSKDTNDQELLIFLTPSIVPERPTAGTGIGVIP